MAENIESIVRVFPLYEEKIDFLFQADENFRDLCKDYLLCAGNVLEMKKKADSYSAEIEEYEELQRNLEQEILHIIIKEDPAY
ncbi:hypothetical protein [Algoriphagus chordae]|uniref:Uncharacterized protein n=1 Tax=Algoriphagus chordae TaxID=237019 RepID=A0A2W7R516_9BACT|nr:hypothetical protein [Algoriphagus chordae]PZX55584.1 hypothetical protein LV85_00809 [Algoriphagus chordae]